jgi:hypothetical protein
MPLKGNIVITLSTEMSTPKVRKMKKMIIKLISISNKLKELIILNKGMSQPQKMIQEKLANSMMTIMRNQAISSSHYNQYLTKKRTS